jgi:heme oxygenase
MILGKLKEATKEQHTNLEGVVSVMDKTMSRTAYQGLIAKFYRFYSAIEPRVAAALTGTGFDFEARRKTALLEQDLVSLGVFNSISERAGEWTDLPAIDTPAKGFGTLYVLEGATLGGQMIKRHLSEHLGIDTTSGGEFFNSYGKVVGPMWKAFGAAITAFAEQNDDDETIVEAAKETFDSFARCFAADVSKVRPAYAMAREDLDAVETLH